MRWRGWLRRGGAGPRFVAAQGDGSWAASLGGMAWGVGGQEATQSGPLPPRLACHAWLFEGVGRGRLGRGGWDVMGGDYRATTRTGAERTSL